MRKIYANQSSYNYSKTEARLENSLLSGRFYSFSQQKKQQIWNRLCRYAKQLGIKIKNSLAAACIAAGLLYSDSAMAQTFTLRTGSANPFNGVAPGQSSFPTFADIDNDGDMDVFIGVYGPYGGNILFYKNTGTAAAPVFTETTGPANPFDGEFTNYFAAPTFVDIDNDGDLDAFVGELGGKIKFYKNTGTPAAPVFTLTTGSADPFNGIDFDYYFTPPTFVDIDNDGDKDAFIGSYYGDVYYYKNTGTPSSPVFTKQTGTADPFNGLVPGYYNAPAFVDVDGDGDFDAFFGELYGSIIYYKNTGTAAAPAFTRQTGANNPLRSVNVGYFSTPTFVDIDGDGDMDAFIGSGFGFITYFENTTIILPLHLVDFSGSRQKGYNQLQWLTAVELNTRSFEVEQSMDGINFKKIASISAVGNNDNSYTVKDVLVYNGKVYYRLKMIDIDGRFTYSSIIWINNEASGDISIYPNPVKNNLNINIGDERLLKTKAGLYDVNGRILRHIQLNSYQVQVNAQSLPKGMYLLKFSNGSVKTILKE